ncbi:MAG TPA: acyl-CoA dehydrogenase family protein [Xanthobacteraceae bacterium]|nr:acyl-CoA dehydrogenase family protein [Xanthobacteraceae bacterium]
MSEAAVRTESAATIASVVAAELKPLVRRIDADGIYPVEVLRQLGTVGAFAQHSASRGAGPAGIVDAVRAMTEIGATCLSTAFCTWCQDALVWYLDRAENPVPRQRYLAAAASGRLLGGTALSNPMKFFSGLEPLALKGRRVAGGYRVTGRLPFVSNLALGHVFGSIFALEDAPERRVMALFRVGDEGVVITQNAHFIALEGTGTYSVLIRDAFVPDDHVLAEDADRFVPRIRKGFVLLQTGMGFGIAHGAALLMRADRPGQRQGALLPLGPNAIEERAAALEQRVQEHVRNVDEPDRGSFLDVLRTRLEVSWLALEAAQSAMLQFGARGYVRGSEPSRRLREAQFVAIVTPSVKHILTELARQPNGPSGVDC